jgi:hypothetical protein
MRAHITQSYLIDVTGFHDVMVKVDGRSRDQLELEELFYELPRDLRDKAIMYMGFSSVALQAEVYQYMNKLSNDFNRLQLTY